MSQEFFEPSVVVHLALSRNPRLDGALRQASAAQLLALDREARRHVINDHDVEHDREPVPTALAVVWSMSRLHSMRRHATSLLSASKDVVAQKALLIRCDDGVADIAASARSSIGAALDAGTVAPATLLGLLPLVDALTRREGWLGSVVASRLRRAARATWPFDVDALPLDTRRSVRGLFGTDVSVDVDSRLVMCLAALSDSADRDLELAIRIARRPGVVDDPRVRRAFFDHDAPAIRVRAARQWKNDVTAVLELSVDGRPEVRRAARLALGPDAGDEIRDRARTIIDNALATGAVGSVLGALGSLAEVGRVDDFSRISRFLHDARSRLQAQAVRALCGSHSQAPALVVDILLDKVTSTNKRVSLEAARGFYGLGAQDLPLAALRAVEDELHLVARRALRGILGPGQWSV